MANPNQVRPKRFWGVYTKLKIFNMTNYKKGSTVKVITFNCFCNDLVAKPIIHIPGQFVCISASRLNILSSYLFLPSCLSWRWHNRDQEYWGSLSVFKVLCKPETFWTSEFWGYGCRTFCNSFWRYDEQSVLFTFLHWRFEYSLDFSKSSMN